MSTIIQNNVTFVRDWSVPQPDYKVGSGPVRLNPSGRTGRHGLDRGDGRLFEHYGPTDAADVAVIVEGDVLLIRRKDTGRLAFPGGRLEPDETARAAAVRELTEEAGVNVTPNGLVFVWAGVCDDPRDSDHSWFESTLFRVDMITRPVVTPGTDATETVWVPFTQLESCGLYRPHQKYVGFLK